MVRVFLGSILLIIAGTSCFFLGKRVKGNGEITAQQRSLGDFSRVSAEGALNLELVSGPQHRVVVEVDENLQQYVELNVDGDRLKVRTKKGYTLRPSKRLLVRLTSPVFRKIELAGAGNITSNGRLLQNESLALSVSGAGDIRLAVQTPEIKVNVAGSGNVKLEGRTRNFDLAISGAGKAWCYDLLAENTTVKIAGAGNAEVFASLKLDARVSGAGNVTYKGNAASVTQKVSGAASIKKAG